jgi:hypothetical protein
MQVMALFAAVKYSPNTETRPLGVLVNAVGTHTLGFKYWTNNPKVNLLLAFAAMLVHIAITIAIRPSMIRPCFIK